MQLESVNNAQNPSDVPEGRRPESAHMIFVPDKGQYFLGLSITRSDIGVESGDSLAVPIEDKDADPFREAKERGDDAEVLRFIRKYIQTKDQDFDVPDTHPLHGSVHETPLGSMIRRGRGGRARFPVFGVVNELPIPEKK
jgi:hypothetical protein